MAVCLQKNYCAEKNAQAVISLSLIIPCCNALSFLKPLVECLCIQTFRDFEWIVVNNASTDGTEEWLRECNIKPKPWVINYSENFGYAVAVNKGIEQALSERIVVLNADLTFDADFLENIVYAFEKKPQMEMASFKVLRREEEKIESSGVNLTSFLRARNEIDPEKILGPQGAAFAFRKSVLPKIQIPYGLLYDERYFFLWEDVELALRLKRRAVQTVFLDKVQCRHWGNASRSRYFYKQYLSLRNRFYLIRTYYPRYFLRYFHVVILYDIPRFIFFMVFNPYRIKILKDLRISGDSF